MPCDTRRLDSLTPEQRFKQIRDSVSKLGTLLQSGKVSVKVDRATGAVAFINWSKEDRADISDVCAVRRLLAKNDVAFKAALAKAEAVAGRKLAVAAVGAGIHSHDGGKTWHGGH